MLPVPSPLVTSLFLILLAAGGLGLIGYTLLSAVRAIVLPRSERVQLNAVVFGVVRWAVFWIAQRGATYAQRDRVMALLGPLGLLALPIVWLSLLSVGYTPVYYALGVRDWSYAYETSGAALLTINSPREVGVLVHMLTFSEAALGLLLIALLITYLPTIYNAFTRREQVVAQLELRAGVPISAGGLVCWLHQSGALGNAEKAGSGVTSVWEQWEHWFLDIEESHTSLPVLSVFRSREPGRSWVTAAATILDATIIIVASVETARDPQRDLCLKAGVITVNRVARFFENTLQPAFDAPHAAVAFGRAEFAAAYEQLRASDIALKLGEDDAWIAFGELRVRYQEPLTRLAHLAMAPVV